MTDDYQKVYAPICRETKCQITQPFVNIKTGEVFDATAPYITQMNPRFLKENYVQINTFRVPPVRQVQFAFRTENLRELLSSIYEVNETAAMQRQINEELFENLENEKAYLKSQIQVIRTLEIEIDELQEKLDLIPLKGEIDDELLGRIECQMIGRSLN